MWGAGGTRRVVVGFKLTYFQYPPYYPDAPLPDRFGVGLAFDFRYQIQYHFAMNTDAKLLDAMRNNPRDWRMEQLLTVARRFGVTVRNDGGSHHVFAHAAVSGIVTVPAHRPIKPVYVRQFVALIDSAIDTMKELRT